MTINKFNALGLRNASHLNFLPDLSCMVVVTAAGYAFGYESDAEVIDLCSGGCSHPLPSLPYVNMDGVSLRTQGIGNPLFCGGLTSQHACHEFDPLLDEWVRGPRTLGQRFQTPSVELGNGSFWLMGSKSSVEDYYTTERYEDGELSVRNKLDMTLVPLTFRVLKNANLVNKLLFNYNCIIHTLNYRRFCSWSSSNPSKPC